MTDKAFEKALLELATVNSKYKTLLRKVEGEIKRRYGVFPSDVDNDSWIDVYHVGEGRMTLKEVDTTMKECLELHPL